MTVPQPQSSDIPGALAAMAAAVQAGDFAAAETIGAAAALPLSIPKAALQQGAQLSEGAQAAVYAALYTPAAATSPLDVAVKRPRIRESADLERFRAEVGLLATLKHPGLVTLLGARMLPPDYCAVMVREATNAEHELHAAGWRPGWAEVAALGAQLAGALAHMHAHGVVHRDVKPANLLLDASRSHARLADLGLAAPFGPASAALFASASSASSDASSQAGSGSGGARRGGRVPPSARGPTGGFHKARMMGTLEYMAPEVLLGEDRSAPSAAAAGAHSPASDVFALGVTLAELSTGVVPYSDCTRDNPLAHTVLEMGYGRAELAAAVAAEGLRPLLRPDTPAPLAALLERCWAKAPGARPAAAEVERELRALLPELAALSRPPSPNSVLPLSASSAAAAAAAGKGKGKGGEQGAEGDAVAVLQLGAEESYSTSDESEGASMGEASEAELMDADLEQQQNEQQQGQQEQPGKQQLGKQRWGGGAAPPAWLAAALQLQPQQAGQQAGQQAQQQAKQAQQPLVGAFASAGARGADRMEDRHLAVTNLGGWEGVTLLAVFDGHRGAEAADYLAANFEQHLQARWGSAASAAELLGRALADADEAFRVQQDAAWARRVAAMGGAAAAGKRPFPGSTATVALLAGGLLAVANLGDSRAVLCRGAEALQLTQDQTAEREDERARIAADGGALRHAMGAWRVGAAGMQVTRSIGDADLKGPGGGLTAEAEVAEFALSPSDTLLLLATDGVWDQLASGDAACIAADTVKHPGMVAQRLVTEALARGSNDNLTAAVAVLPAGLAAGTAERVFGGRRAAGGAAAQGGRKARGALPGVSADELTETY